LFGGNRAVRSIALQLAQGMIGVFQANHPSVPCEAMNGFGFIDDCPALNGLSPACWGKPFERAR